MVEVPCDLLGYIILGRVFIFFFVLAILEHDLSVADLEDFWEMVLEHPTFHILYISPDILKPFFILSPLGLGRPSLSTPTFKRYFLLASGAPGARVTSMASRIF